MCCALAYVPIHEVVVYFEEGLGIYVAQRLGELEGASAEEVQLWTPFRNKLGLFITYMNETWVGSGEVPVEPTFLPVVWSSHRSVTNPEIPASQSAAEGYNNTLTTYVNPLL